MTDQLDLKRSVQRDDVTPVHQSGDVVSIVYAPTQWGSWLAESVGTQQQLGLPPRRQFTRARDVFLRGSLEMDPMWAAAVSKAISKQVARGWEVTDSKDIATRAAYAQSLIELYDGEWERGLQRGLQDYLTTDNGQWVEVIRATAGAGSRITGLAHLDSLRITRTGDPDIPAIYTDIWGRDRPLKAHQVISLAALPSPDVALRGVGYCAASAAWATICKMQAIELYFTEKVTGRRNLAIHLIRGINRQQLDKALTTAENSEQQRGAVFYRGAVLIPGLDAAAEVGVTTIPISAIPEAFDIREERERADNIYANTVGIFVGELRPLTGQGLGNGQQSRVLEEAAEGVGLASWARQWQTAMKMVLPKTTTFAWSTSDLSDRLKTEQVNAAAMGWLSAGVAAGIITPPMAQQIMLDKEMLPVELVPQPDATAGGTLHDTDQADAVTKASARIRKAWEAAKQWTT